MNAVTPIDAKDARDIYGAAGLTAKPAGPVLGAEIGGVDLERPLARLGRWRRSAPRCCSTR